MKCLATLCGLMLASQLVFATETVTVVDQNNRPVANATVLLGYEKGNPFPNNTMTTTSTGVATAPADWKAALPITVTAAGYITTTIPIAMPGPIQVTLPNADQSNQIEIQGINTDFGTLSDNGKVHFGLVIPALTKQQMLAFDLSTVMSPQNDVIDVLGKKLEISSHSLVPTAPC